MAQYKISPNQTEEQNKMKHIQNNTGISSIFNSIILVMKICGVFPLNKESSRTFTYRMHVFYCCLIQIMGVYGAARYLGAFFIGDTSGNFRFHVGILSMAWFFISVSYLCIICLFSSNHIRHLCKSFDKYENNYGIHFNRRKYKHIYDFLAGSLLIWTLIVQTGICTMLGIRLVSPNSIHNLYLWPFHGTNGVPRFLAILMYVIPVCPALANSFGLCFFYLMVLSCVKKEFENVIERVQTLNSRDTISDISNMEDIRKQHQTIVRLLSSANLYLRHIAGGFYAMGIPSICFLIFGISTGSLIWEDGLNTIASIVGNLLLMFAITFTGAKVSSKAHEPLEELHDLDMSNLPQNVTNQIVLFSNRLSGPTIGVSVYGLFVIDYSSVLMIFGTLITYAVIAVQFTSTSSQNCDVKTLQGTNVTVF